ncbi:MAG: sugar phosphate isomerase/epimerase [bacterium]|nr:sugar phosphate isomerase/epimerase [bacterium]
MLKSGIAAQLYTLREHLKTPSDIAVTLEKVRSIGYQSVQVSGMGPIDPEELKRITDDLGLTICATHVNFTSLNEDLDRVIETHRIYQCPYVGLGSMPELYRNKDGFREFARIISGIGAALAEKSLTLIYHNHSFELTRWGGMTGLDILYKESDPSSFQAELDTYWVQHGGGDVVAWIKKLKGRLPVIHLKDMGIRDGRQVMAEVGEGNLDWKAILAFCEMAGVEWYVVEQDTDFLIDPFESLKTSYENLLRMGLK